MSLPVDVRDQTIKYYFTLVNPQYAGDQVSFTAAQRNVAILSFHHISNESLHGH